MTILITGAAGFIGQALSSSFLPDEDVILVDMRTPRHDHGHRFIHCDLADWESVRCLPDADTIYHMCAYNNTAHFYSKPFTVADNTLTPTINLLRRYRSCGKFIYSSSGEIYASAVSRNLCTVPTPEVDMAMIDGITNPRWSYGGAKLMGEILVHGMHLEHGMPYLILRYHNVYGPDQVAHFIPEYVERLVSGDDVLMGADQTRAFLYIDDAIKLTRMVASMVLDDTVNIGSDVESNIVDVAAEIRKILGIDRDPIPVPAPNGSVQRRLADISKLRGYVGDFQFTDIRVGLERTIRSLCA